MGASSPLIDNGAPLYVDGQLKIDQWAEAPPNIYTAVPPTGQPPLKPLHSESTLNKTTLDYWRKKSTDEIIESLKPGQTEALRVKPDGTMMNGHHRIKVLQERGVDVNSLPRELYRSLR
jgi:hypothetical protein